MDAKLGIDDRQRVRPHPAGPDRVVGGFCRLLHPVEDFVIGGQIGAGHDFAVRSVDDYRYNCATPARAQSSSCWLVPPLDHFYPRLIEWHRQLGPIANPSTLWSAVADDANAPPRFGYFTAFASRLAFRL